MRAGSGVRRLLVLAVLVTGVAVSGVAESAVPRCAAPGRLSTEADLWTKISAPKLSGGGSLLTDYDVSPLRRNELLVTNGDRIAVSRDSGCRWTESVVPAPSPLPTLPLGDGGTVVSATLTQVRAAALDPMGAWAIGESTVVLAGGPQTQPRLLQSADGARHFTDRSGSFPSVFGRPVAVRPLTADTALLLFQQTAPKNTYEVFATSDGGASWKLYFSGLPALSDLGLRATADGRPQLLAWGPAGLYGALVEGKPDYTDLTLYQTSTATMTRLDGVTGEVVALTMAGNEFTAYLAAAAQRLTSRDDGRTFQAQETIQGVSSASQGPLPGLVALSGREVNVWVEPPRHPAFRGLTATDFSPAERVSRLKFSMDYGSAPGYRGAYFPLYAFSPKALYRRDIPADFRLPTIPPPPPVPGVDLHGVKPVRRGASLTPDNAVITLLPGQRKTVDYAVGLPATPTPLDVFFMTDSTGSMSSAIVSVQDSVQRIVDRLAASGIDVNFGVADFRDYAQPRDTAGADNYPYKRRRPIGPVNAELASALEGITTGGGTTDGDDSALEAVYQATTGAGRQDPLLVRGQLIPPGLGAEWRAKARGVTPLKVILLASDDEMRHPEANPGYPGPSVTTVASALRENDVHLVGIAVRTTGASPRADMITLARASNTFAPAGGIDCDGDGQTTGADDVAANEPIVCPFSPETSDSIAPTFIALLEGIRDFAAVDLAVGAERGVARPLGPTHFPKVNLRAPSDYRLPVEFRCDGPNLGTTSRVRITVRSRGAEVGATTATVRCGPAERPARPLPLAQLPAVVPPPPPPAPVSNAQPNPNPNPNPNPQLGANVGVATSDQDQAQLATAENDQGTDGSDEVAFSARRTEAIPELAWVGAVLLMSVAAFGTHLARRSAAAGQLGHQPNR